jgi:hypothetical protein
MPGLLDWWYRIRRVVGPPGASGTRAAVPTDVESARRAELAIVFEHCDQLEPQLRARENECEREIEKIRANAAAEVERTLTEGHLRAAAARAEASTALERSFEREATEFEQHADSEVAALQRRTSAAMAGLVSDAVDLVRGFASGEQSTAAPRPRTGAA